MSTGRAEHELTFAHSRRPDPSCHSCPPERPCCCRRGPRPPWPLPCMPAHQWPRAQCLSSRAGRPPSFGREIRLSARVWRFYCHNQTCLKQTFTKPLPRLLKPYARHTQRLAKAQGRIGIALGGEPAARLLADLAMPASADTVLRLVRDQPLPVRQPPRIVGADDWAMKKGRTYGSILIDLERRKPIEFLPNRSASTCSAWLWRHPDIEIIARDRSSEYARGAATASKAIQVADRWHLLLNAARWSSAGWREPMLGCGACPSSSSHL